MKQVNIKPENYITYSLTWKDKELTNFEWIQRKSYM